MKKNREDNIKGKGFDAFPEHINKKGRPKTIISVMKELKTKGCERVSPANIVEAWEYLLNLSKEEISQIANDEQQPMILRIPARELLKNPMKTLGELLDRTHGKPTQTQQIINDTPPQFNIIVESAENRDILGDTIKKINETD